MQNNKNNLSDADIKYLKLLIKKSKVLAKTSEPPFTALITKDNKLIAESLNEVITKNDVTLHAEICTLKLAQTKLQTYTLAGCTLYSICEPCPMCSFIIRELHISRVVYAIRSHNMGGHSKWNILEDPSLEQLPRFSAAPNVIGDIMSDEVYKIFEGANFHHMFSSLTK